MTQQIINDSPANSGLGDPLKVAFDKVNANDAELYGKFSGTLALPGLFGGPVWIKTDLANSIAGGVPGLKVTVSADGSPNNPASTDSVALYTYISSVTGKNRIWAVNPVTSVNVGNDATAFIMEADMNNNFATAPDPDVALNKIGIDVASGGTFAPSVAFYTASTTLANRWKHGIWFNGIGGQAGSTLIKTNVNVSIDYGLDLANATVNFMGLRIGQPTNGVVAGAGIRQTANGQIGLFLQRFTDTAPTGNVIQVTNTANSVVLASIDANGNFAGSSLGLNGSAAPAQPTGYGTPTGNALLSSFASGSITLPQLAAEVAQLIIDLKKYGILGA